jgi:hypothetical protein
MPVLPGESCGRKGYWLALFVIGERSRSSASSLPRRILLFAGPIGSRQSLRVSGPGKKATPRRPGDAGCGGSVRAKPAVSTAARTGRVALRGAARGAIGRIRLEMCPSTPYLCGIGAREGQGIGRVHRGGWTQPSAPSWSRLPVAALIEPGRGLGSRQRDAVRGRFERVTPGGEPARRSDSRWTGRRVDVGKNPLHRDDCAEEGCAASV